jgi:hypothetical protein
LRFTRKNITFLVLSLIVLNLVQYYFNGKLKSANEKLLDNLEFCRDLLEQKQSIKVELDSLSLKLRTHSELLERVLPKLVFRESSNNPCAVGDRGKSIGLAQVQLRTANYTLKRRDLTVEDLYNPYVNPFLAIEYLEYLQSRYGSIENTLSAYNGGLRIRNGRKIITNAEYVQDILGDLENE